MSNQRNPLDLVKGLGGQIATFEPQVGAMTFSPEDRTPRPGYQGALYDHAHLRRPVVEKPALAKAKYTRRWRGADGKWRYEYADEKKPAHHGGLQVDDHAEFRRKIREGTAVHIKRREVEAAINKILPKRLLNRASGLLEESKGPGMLMLIDGDAKAESARRLQAAGFSVESIHGGLRIRHGAK